MHVWPESDYYNCAKKAWKKSISFSTVLIFLVCFRYLLYLTITIYNDETYGIFKQEPPNGVLANYSDITFNKDLPQAAWETETQWADTLCDLPADTKFVSKYPLLLHPISPAVALLSNRTYVTPTDRLLFARTYLSNFSYGLW